MKGFPSAWLCTFFCSLWPSVIIASDVTVSKPNILFVVADDLGWDDVGFRSHQIQTPTIDALSTNGVILDQYYVQCVCSPSRASFLSGLYPLHHSINDWIPSGSRYGLPLNITTLPDYLSRAGYATHAVGKWHLGFYKWDYTPTFRGFESFYGFYSGGEGYFSHGAGKGYDFRRDTGRHCGKGCSVVESSAKGNYSTILFASEAVSIVEKHNTSQPLFLYLAFQAVHSPREVPASYTKPYNGKIADGSRKSFAGMLTCMDEGFGNVTTALKKRGMLENTLIIFTADNGGPLPDTPGGDYVGSRNWPLRGGKHSIWEGGTRATAVVDGPMIKVKPSVYSNLMHGSDWLPTILSLVGLQPGPDPLDGVDQWAALTNNGSAVRSEVLYGWHDDAPNSTYDNAIRIGPWKYFQGTGGKPTSWYPPVNASGTCDVTNAHECGYYNDIDDVDGDGILLYNLEDDPTEHHDVSSDHSAQVTQLQTRLAALLKTGVPTAKNDPSCATAVLPTDPVVGKYWDPWC